MTIKTFQTEPNAVHYTQEKLYCSICCKQQKSIIETEKKFYCWTCFYKNLRFLFDNNEYVYIREIIDALYNQRKETYKKERQILTLKLRFIILKRDYFQCVLCGKTAKDAPLEIDHIVPVSKGGKTVVDNLQTLCFDCNRGKSAL